MTKTGVARPRRPGVVMAALALAMIVLVATFALRSRQPPPPTIAEFAPQAVENITDSPSDQSSSQGTGVGDCVAGGPCGDGPGAGPAIATPAPIDVPRVRRCVGDPPRQIEDPQSPPCVPYWTGDNGGATAPGVTRDQIRIGVQGADEYTPLLEAFFNKRFEFYGRRLTSVTVPDSGTGAPEAQRSAAVAAAEQAKVFGVVRHSSATDRGFHYNDELARRKVIATGDEAIYEDATFKSWRPYVWQYPMSADRLFANLGEWTCARLAGAPASHAGPALAATPRAFGIVLTRDAVDNPLSTQALNRHLSACGIKPVSELGYIHDGDEYNAQVNSNIVLQMRQAGATSILCLCAVFASGQVARNATSQGYFPEWLLSTYLLQDANITLRAFFPSEHRVHAFGLTSRPQQVAPEDNPSRWAGRDVDPSYDEGGTAIAFENRNRHYRAFLLMASGLQLAGPKLTAASFEAGLHRAVFPNPPHPIMAGSVGFRDGDHTMTDDLAEFWWSDASRGPYTDDQAGTLCYVAGGARHVNGSWPGGDPFFQGPCAGEGR